MNEERLSIWRREVLERAVLGDVDIPFPKETGLTTTSEIWRKFLDEVMDRLVKERRKDESNIIHNGKTPVWFSHDVDKGGLKHWLLILHDYKYELRRSEKACCHSVACDHGVAGSCCVQHECGKGHCCREHQCRSHSRSTCPNHAPDCENSRIDGYYFKKTHFLVDIEQRERAITQLGKPQKGRYYIGLIGSTLMTQVDVEQRFKSRMQEFGDYHMFSNNCQHFVVEVAKQIVEDKAPDWKWFADNLVSAKSHNYVKRLHGVPVDVMAAWSETLKDKRNDLPVELRIKVDRNIRIIEQFIQSFKVRVSEGQMSKGPTDAGFFPTVESSPMSGGTKRDDCDDGHVECDVSDSSGGMQSLGEPDGASGSHDGGGGSCDGGGGSSSC